MSLLHIGGGSGSSAVAPEGVDFDGVSDYLSRSSDLVGNVDSKTFTFSAWVYCGSNIRGAKIIDFRSVAGDQGSIIIGDFGELAITMRNSIGTTILSATAPNYTIPYLTYINILISIDLTNSANRKIYISDIDKTASFTFATYTNGFIDFTKTTWRIGNDQSLTGIQIKGRLSNVFLAYEYVDLSVESNRRMFITSDGKPA